MNATSISKLFVVAALTLGITFAWTCFCPQIVGASGLIGGGLPCKRCEGDKILYCSEVVGPSCTGTISVCEIDLDGLGDCIEEDYYPCTGPEPCEDKRNKNCIPL